MKWLSALGCQPWALGYQKSNRFYLCPIESDGTKPTADHRFCSKIREAPEPLEF